MSSRTRPELPRGRPSNALAAPSVPIDAAAVISEHDEDMLLAAAEAAMLPPWTAFKHTSMPRMTTTDPRWLWRFSAQITHSEIESHMSDGVIWLHRLHHHDSDLTAAWGEAAAVGHEHLALIADWCRCARPDPLNSDRGIFAMWCADHLGGPQMTARRHATLSLWFQMLRQEGVPDVAETHPAERTRIMVATDE